MSFSLKVIIFRRVLKIEYSVYDSKAIPVQA